MTQIIRKLNKTTSLKPNLSDYDASTASFSWENVRRELTAGSQGSGVNIAYVCVDRHVERGDAHRPAIRCIDKEEKAQEFSYGDLRSLTNRFANLLKTLDVTRGDVVASLLNRQPELYVTALGTLKYGCVFCPLFSYYGPEPLKARLSKANARVLVTTESLYVRKIKPLRAYLPALTHVLLVRESEQAPSIPDTWNYQELLDDKEADFEMPDTTPDTLALLHFTSGTTGSPKGVMHVHDALVGHYLTGKYALDLHPGDVFWCTADPGWVTGVSYGILAPLAIGATLVVDREEFDARRWYRILQNQKVTVWYTAPTAIRLLMKFGAELAKQHDTRTLRFMASVGEPLNPAAVIWGQETFGLPFHDTWWQTETGCIMIANIAAMDIKPGSMGKPMPGIEAAVVKRTGPEGVARVDTSGEPGELALKTPWPSMFRGFLEEPERYAACFRQGWYLSGDLVTRDGDGYFWFVGRADDLIKSSGHLIGPFEVERALLEHAAVADVGVIGKPDAVAMEIVKAFIELKPGYQSGEALRREILGWARDRLGVAVAPKEIEFIETVPKTHSGKVLRRVLKARELGMPEGDVSSLAQRA